MLTQNNSDAEAMFVNEYEIGSRPKKGPREVN